MQLGSTFNGVVATRLAYSHINGGGSRAWQASLYRQEGWDMWSGGCYTRGRMWARGRCAVRDEARASRRAAGAQVSRARGARRGPVASAVGHAAGERRLVCLTRG